MSRYDLAEFEWRVIGPLLPDKPRGVPRVDDRRTLHGIFWVLRSCAPWRDLPERDGPCTTCHNRFVRWQNQAFGTAKRLYRERDLNERFFSELKHFRRIATRYDELVANFLAMVQRASTRLWRRAHEPTT